MLSERVRKTAARQLKKDLDLWLFDEDMLEMVLHDFKDHLKISTVIVTKGLAKTLPLIRYLDTSSREALPSTLLDALELL